MSRARRAALGAVLPVLLLILWQVAGRAGAAPRFLSWPGAILAALAETLGDGELQEHAAASGGRWACGLLLGGSLGLAIGLAAGRLAAVRWLFDPLVAFINPIPKITFLPVVVLLLGLGHSSKIVLVALTVFFPVYLAAQHASRSVDHRLLWVARNSGAGRWQTTLGVILPAAMPELFAGLRVGMALSFVSLFAAELMGTSNGLGQLIASGEEYQRYDLMLLGILSFAVTGYVADRLLLLLRGRMVRGPPAHQTGQGR